MPKKREKISQCPPSVQNLIDVANSLPEDFPSVIFRREDDIKIQKKLFYEMVNKFPKEFIDTDLTLRAFLEGKTEDASERPGWIPEDKWQEKWFVRWEENSSKSYTFNPYFTLQSAFFHVRNVRETLKQVLEYNSLQIIEGWVSIPTKENPIPRQATRVVYKNKDDILFNGFRVENGVYEVRLNPTFTVLVNEKTDTRRIKQCRKCKNFFWAKRLNKNVENEACEKCSNVLSQRQFQTNHKEEIRKQRRIAYYRNKGIKILCEKCGRPQIKCGGC